MRKLAFRLFVLASVVFLLLCVSPRAGGGIAAAGAPVTVAEDTAASTWKILLIVFQETDTDYVDEDGQRRHLTASLSNPEIDALLTSFTGPVTQAVRDWSAGAVQWDVDVRYAPRPVTGLSSASADHKQWLDPDSIQDVIDLYSPDGAYDQIMVYWKDSDGTSTIPSWGWGLALPYSASRNWCYLTVAAIPASYWNATVPDTWSQVWIHEWLHCACSYYAARGYAMPTSDADGGGSHGYVEEQEGMPGWGSFYSDLMQGRVEEDGRLLGVTREAWLSGSPRLSANVRSLQGGWNLLAGGPGSSTGGLILFGWNGTGYVSLNAGSMQGGEGYWCRAGNGDSATLTTTVSPISVSLIVGWNLIGNSTSSTVSLPQGLIAFLYHNGAYVSSSTLAPGEGAWVKSTAVQTIRLE